MMLITKASVLLLSCVIARASITPSPTLSLPWNTYTATLMPNAKLLGKRDVRTQPGMSMRVTNEGLDI